MRANEVARNAPLHAPRSSALKHNGYILLPVMFAVVLVATIAFMMNHETVTNIALLNNGLDGDKAEYVAQAGLHHALWQTQQQGCGPFTDLSAAPLGGDTYTTSLTTDLGSTSSYTIDVDQDTWISSADPTGNYGDDNRLNIRFQGGISERPLFRFDLTPIAAGADILSATAWFYVTGMHPEGAVAIHRVTADWTEDGATWEAIGDEMEPAVLASIPPQDKDGVWVAVNLAAQVQAWVNGQPNYGVVLATGAEGAQGDYAAREDTNRPYLEVVVGTPPTSPARLESVGTLASGVSRSITRNDVILRQQPEGTVHLQPGATEGKDTYLYQWKQTWNYGARNTLAASRWPPDSDQHALLTFDLNRVPAGAHILSATLELHSNTNSWGATNIDVHRVTNSWEEGSATGGAGPGANWTQRDASVSWGTAGGDYEPGPAASAVTPGGLGWVAWDVTALVAGWVNGGVANVGMLLKASGNYQGAEFDSSDAGNAALRPKLTIEYACECGSPCLAPRGSGTVLMVVVNPTTLVATDVYKKALFESWSYTVAIIGESENQATYDSAIADADVVFVSETVNASQVGDKLKDATIGVVSQDGIYNDDLGLAAGSAWPVGSAINVTDASHYITAVFPSGLLEIYAAGMEQLTVSGAGAAGLQTLADTGGAGSLVVLDTGVDLYGGGTAAGRRVMLPLGRDSSFRWDSLNANGRLLVQRALAWGMGADSAGPPPKNLLFVSGGETTVQAPFGDLLVIPTALEQARVDLIESWGYTVNLIADDDSQANFEAAVTANDVAYVSSQVSETALGTKLKNTTIGVVNELGVQVDEFGFAQQGSVYKSRTEIDVLDNTHYITEPFATGLLSILSSAQTFYLMTTTQAPGLEALGQAFNTGSLWDDALAVLETGAELFGGGNAAGRRVLLPWGDATFDVAALNADGQTLMRRAIEWAEGADTAAPQKLLLVVGNVGSLTAEETAHKNLVESWGYTVELIDDGADQASFDGAVAGNDVVLLTNDVTASTVDIKLVDASIGVVTSEANLSDAFGISASVGWDSGTQIEINDNSHYITQPFATGTLTILPSAESLAYVTGTPSPDLGQLASSTSGFGVVTLEAGAATHTGGVAAGRRVQLPWGGNGFHPDNLTSDGKTLLQRALEWGAGASSGTPEEILLVVADAASLTAQETARKTLIDGWGYDVKAISASDSQANFDGAVASANAAYVVEQQQSTALGTKLRDATIAVINEEAELRQDIGFSANRDWPSTRDTVDIIDNSHYITQPFATGLLTIATAPIEVVTLTGQMAGGLQVLGQQDWGGPQSSLSIIDTGGALYGGGNAAGRRVQLPWGRTGFDINLLNADGLTIMRRAIEWGVAGGGGSGPTPPACTATFADDFETGDYTGSTGTAAWAGDWIEVNETTNPANGDVQVATASGNRVLQIGNSAEGAQRVADLSAYASATLTFGYWRSGLDAADEYASVEVSSDGSNWTLLDQYLGPGNDPTSSPPTVVSYDISAHLSATTYIRVLTAGVNARFDRILFDDFEICADN